MRRETGTHEDEGRIQSPTWKRAAWFVALWAGGVAVVATVGYALRFVLG